MGYGPGVYVATEAGPTPVGSGPEMDPCSVREDTAETSEQVTPNRGPIEARENSCVRRTRIFQRTDPAVSKPQDLSPVALNECFTCVVHNHESQLPCLLRYSLQTNLTVRLHDKGRTKEKRTTLCVTPQSLARFEGFVLLLARIMSLITVPCRRCRDQSPEQSGAIDLQNGARRVEPAGGDGDTLR